MNNIQIIIPMTGNGSRFVEAGYDRLKPFIQVFDKPIIEWVVRMFPGDQDKITFICRQEHLETFAYVKEELARIAPGAKIFAIKDWEKKGPVFDVLKAKDIISDEIPTIISYCDYYMHWDYQRSLREVMTRGSSGAIPCYSGFHPHLIPEENLYASCKVDENENLIEIREKFSWEQDKTKARHSPGLYYFINGKTLKKYCELMVQQNDNVKGEFYASLVYNYLVEDNLEVWCPISVPIFCQWGTPKDLEECVFWIKALGGLKL